VWIDAQLPPVLAEWLSIEPVVMAVHTFSLGLLGASDRLIFDRAREARAILVTKDADFVELVTREGPPPQVVWVTSGNITNAGLRRLVSVAWPRTIGQLLAGDAVVELSERRSVS
jgi:predicted nuclease of predicted toxin-antitoxin system